MIYWKNENLHAALETKVYTSDPKNDILEKAYTSDPQNDILLCQKHTLNTLLTLY